MGLHGMTNAALLWRCAYSPDFGDYQIELLPTYPCADPLRCRSVSLLLFFSLCSLTYLIFLRK
jgi:hypothetical protein